MKKMNKVLVLALAVCLLAMAAMGATLAWLVSTPEAKTNTFVEGSKVAITLTETTTDYQIMPGRDIAKDPKITVDAASEDCWVFVQIDAAAMPVYEEGTREGFTWSIAGGWTLVGEETNVWARKYEKGSGAAEYGVLLNNVVSVSDHYSDTEVVGGGNLNMVITAYAIQEDYITGGTATECTAEQAWTALQDQI